MHGAVFENASGAGTEELAAIQTLRFAYYMDTGQSAYLPWTPLRLYDWFKSRVAGINIDTTLNPGSIAASCCSTINGRLYITQAPLLNDLNRMNQQSPLGLAAHVALFAHETRHSEGNDYGHVSCCGFANACDQTYDEKNLSPYGIQYYLFKQWLTGAINLGYSCDAATRAALATSFLATANIYPSLFCDAKPPVLSLPPAPGGACVAACSSVRDRRRSVSHRRHRWDVLAGHQRVHCVVRVDRRQRRHLDFPKLRIELAG